jgi:hypothetical protein
MYCKSCITIEKNKKREATNIKKYGTKCALQSESVKKKAIKTCMERYLAQNILKWTATQAEGYTMEFWVFSGKGERTVITVPSIVSNNLFSY